MSGRVNGLKHRLKAVLERIFRRKKNFVFEKTPANPCFKINAKVEVNVKLVQRDDFPKNCSSHVIAVIDGINDLTLFGTCKYVSANMHAYKGHFL